MEVNISHHPFRSLQDKVDLNIRSRYFNKGKFAETRLNVEGLRDAILWGHGSQDRSTPYRD